MSLKNRKRQRREFVKSYNQSYIDLGGDDSYNISSRHEKLGEKNAILRYEENPHSYYNVLKRKIHEETLRRVKARFK